MSNLETFYSNKDLTVVINYYKNDDLTLFKDAFISVCNQSLRPSVVLIVVDGEIPLDSKIFIDEFFSIGREFCINVQFIYLKNNIGLGPARNFAVFNHVKTKLFAVMDSDDISHFDRFKLQINAFNSENADLVGGQITEGSNRRIVPCNKKSIINMLKIRSPFNHVSVMFKTSSFKRIGGYGCIKHIEDFELFYKCFKCNLHFYNINDVLVYVKFDSNDANRRHGYKYFLSIYQLFHLMYRDGFISFFHFLKIVSMNFIFRCSPIFVLKFAYNFLRS